MSGKARKAMATDRDIGESILSAPLMHAELPKQRESQTSKDSGRFTALVRNTTREICRSQKSDLSSLHLSFISFLFFFIFT